LWFGWFGFNAGSALGANGTAGLALLTTQIGTGAALMTWLIWEKISGHAMSAVGAATGAVVGLVAITPAAGFVGLGGALIIGLAAGFACLWGVSGLKRLMGADDALDVFGVHGIGGILGALLTGVFAAPSLGGSGLWDYVANDVVPTYSIGSQVLIQAIGVGVTVLWSAIVAFIAFKIADLLVGLRVTTEQEREGLDISSHGEAAYDH